jgi:hypothetical protein
MVRSSMEPSASGWMGVLCLRNLARASSFFSSSSVYSPTYARTRHHTHTHTHHRTRTTAQTHRRTRTDTKAQYE